MAKKEDDRLQLRISNKLTNVGLRAPCRFNLDVYNGSVTIKGLVQYEYQRRAAIQTIRSQDGVQSVIDQLKVQPPVHNWDDDDNRPGGGRGLPEAEPSE